MNRFTITTICCFSTAAFLSGCETGTLASRDKLNEAQQKLQTAGDNLGKMTTDHAKNVRIVRRELAFAYLISNGMPATESPSPTNIDPRVPEASFQNYVCAGIAQGTGPLRGAKYIAQYNKQVAKILTVPPDTLSGQLAALKVFADSKTEIVPLPTENDVDKEEENCRAAVGDLLKLAKSVPIRHKKHQLEAFDPISMLAIYQAVTVLIDKGKQLAKDALKIAVEIRTRQQLTEFVVSNQSNFNKVLTEQLDNTELEGAWKMRRAASLYRPYLLFSAAMNGLESEPGITTAIGSKYRKSFDAIDKSLAEFDAMSTTPSPASFREAVKKSQDVLLALATNKDVSLSEIVGFLTEMSDMIDTVRTDWSDLAEAAEASRKAFP